MMVMSALISYEPDLESVYETEWDSFCLNYRRLCRTLRPGIILVGLRLIKGRKKLFELSLLII